MATPQLECKHVQKFAPVSNFRKVSKAGHHKAITADFVGLSTPEPPVVSRNPISTDSNHHLKSIKA